MSTVEGQENEEVEGTERTVVMHQRSTPQRKETEQQVSNRLGGKEERDQRQGPSGNEGSDELSPECGIDMKGIKGEVLLDGMV